VTYYCRIDSMLNLESTNLQLYSLQKAADEWNNLVDLIAEGGVDSVDRFRERLVFILVCFGLTLSQLLGQNCPSPQKDKMGQPGALLAGVLKRAHVDPTRKRRLESTFRAFLSYYNAVRHFGENRNQRNYRTVDKLTLNELNRFRLFTIEIWDVVIEMYREDEKNEIDEFRSVSEVVCFTELSTK